MVESCRRPGTFNHGWTGFRGNRDNGEAEGSGQKDAEKSKRWGQKDGDRGLQPRMDTDLQEETKETVRQKVGDGNAERVKKMGSERWEQ